MTQQPETHSKSEIRHWPLVVQLRRKTVNRGRWEAYSWSVAAVASDRHVGGQRELTVEHKAVAEDCCDYHWRGLSLEIFRDERAAYRFNLSSDDPRLFVVCNEEDEDQMQPFLITASQDEAASYMDGGEEDVFSLPMPEAVQCWIESFIGRHGEPDLQARKGKRRNHGRQAKGASQAVAQSDVSGSGAKEAANHG
ncbi:MAG: DUF3305 domain-containing protein [Motiliproteus sp.]|nr:DUF3305 domain-containing protein [Motiliproteus sp.]MCW9052916.1 DUF3305 domain-containing protein [Motiliproteus sp.]